MKRALSLFAFIMLLCILMPQVWGQDYDGYISSGGSNPNGRIYYKISNGHAELMSPIYFWGDNDPWGGYESFKPAGTITLPSNIVHGGSSYTVTSIGRGAFAGCRGLSITIPNSVTVIDNYAFSAVDNIIYSGTATGAHWGALTVNGFVENGFVYSDAAKTMLTGYIGTDSVIVIPDGVISIGHHAFYGKTRPVSVTIPNSVTSIGYEAFVNCLGLTSVFFNADSCEVVDQSLYAFSGDTNINRFIFGNTVRKIPDYICGGLRGLNSVTIENSVTSIGEGAFIGCSRLTSVNYTGNIAQWCNIDFANDESNPISHSHSLNINGISVSNLVIPDGMTTIKRFAFIHCSGLTSVTIPNSVTSIGDKAFSGCSGLTSVTIPNSVTSIGDNAFSGCSGLTSLTIPNSVTTIGNHAFNGCSRLTSVTIPQSVTFIGTRAFANCLGLTSVVFNADSCNASGSPDDGAFVGDINITRFSFGNTVRIIPSSLCRSLRGLDSITIPNSVTTIGAFAFFGCDRLTSVNYTGTIAQWCNINLVLRFPSTSVFHPFETPHSFSINGTLVTNLVIPDSIATIKEYTFTNCTSLVSVTIPNSVSSIGDWAFGGCSGLTSVTCEGSTPPTGNGRIPTSAVINLPCGATNAYTSSWGTQYTYREPIPYAIGVTSSDSTKGVARVQQQCLCSDSTAVIFAYPASGYRFLRWDDGNTDNPRSVHMTSDTSFVAIFDTNVYTATAANCLFIPSNAINVKQFQYGESAIVIALPQSGTLFRRWADGVTSNPRYITVTSDTTLTPIFSSAGTDTVVVYDTVRLNTTVYDTTAVTHYVYDTVHHYQYDTLQVVNTVYDTTAVTHYVYDTVHHYQYDTLQVFNTVYDTTTVTRYVYDTVRVYDTLTVLNIDTVHHYHYDTVTNVHTLHYQYDTTRVFDTLTIVNMDTLHHYHYDTTAVNHYFYDTVRVFDTLTVLNIDTLHHYHYDTTRVYDTLTIVNIDTLRHYFYDTTRVFDTLTVLNVDTVHHYHYDTTAVNHYTFDTTRIYDTLMIVNVDTLRHYFYDTTRVFDTLTVLHSDTLHRYHTDTIVSFRTLYQYDTTRVYDTLHRYHVDTIVSFRTLYHYDTTRVYDTLRSVRIDTVHHYFYGYTTVDTLYRYFYDTTEVTHMIFDTTTVTHYIYNTTWIVDTIYLYDTLYVGTEGINDAGWVNARVYTTGSEIVVEGLAGHTVRLYDITGRMLERRDDGYDIVRFPVPASGTYVVRIGDRTVRKVVVIL